MNKYTSVYTQKLAEELGHPHITDKSRPQDPNTAGLLGAAGSLFWPVGGLAPGLYAGNQSESLGETAKASLRGVINPILGSLGGAAIGGLGGATLGGLAGSLSADPHAAAAGALGGGGLGLGLGALLGLPAGGYIGARSGANKYNEILKKINDLKGTKKDSDKEESKKNDSEKLKK